MPFAKTMYSAPSEMEYSRAIIINCIIYNILKKNEKPLIKIR